ncbi:TrmH family RNA methyltransferase [Nocardioides sp. LHG3406-4]|uniref:TrmH family RNA methyltransferase n=1 Tax=Nocardioides sp. LHG3406-4 TaxID=2804575 RepID=UPI003CF62A4A
MSPDGPARPLAASNGRVKAARRLARRPDRTEQRLFLADGAKAVEGALSVEGCVVEVFATPFAADGHRELLAAAERVTLVDERAMAGLSDSVNPSGVVAVCRFVDVPFDAIRTPPRLVAIAAWVRDPGNAGTLIRTADAAGADGVVLAGTTVDAYNPKTVRATVGSLFHLPIVVEPDPVAAVEAARAAGLTVLAATGDAAVDLYDADLSGPTAWVFGNEAWGLPSQLADLADHRVAIPIHGRAESLNLSTAAAICLYASARAHRS